MSFFLVFAQSLPGFESFLLALVAGEEERHGCCCSLLAYEIPSDKKINRSERVRCSDAHGVGWIDLLPPPPAGTSPRFHHGFSIPQKAHTAAKDTPTADRFVATQNNTNAPQLNMWPLLLLLLAALVLRAEATTTCPNSVAPNPAALASLPSGKCQIYHPELPGTGSLSFCNGIVDYPFFMPSTFASQQEMDILAETQLLGTNPNTGLLLSILPAACTLQLKRSVCLAVFQPCEVCCVKSYFSKKLTDDNNSW